MLSMCFYCCPTYHQPDSSTLLQSSSDFSTHTLLSSFTSTTFLCSTSCVRGPSNMLCGSLFFGFSAGGGPGGPGGAAAPLAGCELLG